MEIRILVAKCQDKEALDSASDLELIEILGEDEHGFYTVNGWDIDVYTRKAFECRVNEQAIDTQNDFLDGDFIRIVVYKVETTFSYSAI